MRLPRSVEFFCLLTATIRANGLHHARGWSRASTQMVANKKKKSLKQTGKTHYKIVLEETLKVYISRTSVFTNI